MVHSKHSINGSQQEMQVTSSKRRPHLDSFPPSEFNGALEAVNNPAYLSNLLLEGVNVVSCVWLL